jgi:LytS/YehU family sensor histidine kinase
VLFFPYLVSSASDQYKIGHLPGPYFTLSGIIHMIIFYVNALLLYPKFLNRRYWLLYIVSVILLVTFSYWVKFYMLAGWFPGALQDARSHVLFPSVLTFIASVFYSITVDKIRAEKQQKENEAMQLGMELKFLRSQISPHFMFNVLTNLVSLARKKSDHLETSLLMLADLMRYMLYDAGKKISLQQEVAFLESYVALQKLRFGRDVNIVFNVESPHSATNYHIEPMLLIPFAENAFKHGTGYVDQPAIDIHLTTKENVLFFQVKNKFDQEADTSKDEISGIGLSNVRSRLALLYPGTHDLVIHIDKNLFSIHLTLKLI